MSATETQQTAPALPAVKEAFAHILSEVHTRAYFAKLAELGVPAPVDEAEAKALLDLGFQLAAVPGTEKQAGAAGPYTLALTALNDVLGEVSPLEKAAAAKTAQDNQSTAWANELAQDPQIYASALSLLQARAAAA